MTPDEQEALSRKYSNDIIMLLPLSSGGIAVFNSARELCSILPPSTDCQVFREAWRPPKGPALQQQLIGALSKLKRSASEDPPSREPGYKDVGF